jgi:fused signal recognition particle receptor
MNQAQIEVLLESALAWIQSHPLAWLAEHPELAGAVAVGLAAIAALAVGLRRRRRGAPAAAEAPAASGVPPEAAVSTTPSPRAEPRVAPPPTAAAPAELPAEPPPAVEVEPVSRPEPPARPAPVPPPAPARLRDRLARTRETLVGRLGRVLGSRRVDGEVLDDLEALLFGADLGVSTADSLLAAVRSKASGGDADAVRRVLRESILEKLRRVEPPADALPAGRPHVILVLGVNGSGKTTTIGKLASRYRTEGKRVLIGAGDTFRAAAIEQLEIWAERVGCELVKGRAGGDPAAVAFDTVKAASARGHDVAIIDTAGRLQTHAPLVEELRKVARVIGKECPGAPHETLLVLDANTGQNAISQARIFTEAVGVTGLVLTKLDGTAKGGVLVGLADAFGIPVRYVGVGEGVADLREFHAEEFVDALFAAGGGEA